MKLSVEGRNKEQLDSVASLNPSAKIINDG
jgi:hypothetical protein